MSTGSEVFFGSGLFTQPRAVLGGFLSVGKVALTVVNIILSVIGGGKVVSRQRGFVEWKMLAVGRFFRLALGQSRKITSGDKGGELDLQWDSVNGTKVWAARGRLAPAGKALGAIPRRRL